MSLSLSVKDIVLLLLSRQTRNCNAFHLLCLIRR
jgi:hypothetical protein